MRRLVLDAAGAAELPGLLSPVELVDTAGNVIGTFVPDLSKYGLNVPFTEEELRASEAETGGRTLDEILADLEARG
jgi:hypothetical protein